VSQHLAKGSKVLVTGELEASRAYLDRDGNAAASTEITGLAVEFLDSRSQEQGALAAAPKSVAFTREDYEAQQRAQQVQDEDIPF
jgi:single-stranded DNA-binding protein